MSEIEQCSTAKIVPPDMNVSGIKFFTDYGTDEIFWSLSRIKMLGGKSVEYIIAERGENDSFTSIENFIHRIFRYKLKSTSTGMTPITNRKQLASRLTHAISAT